MLYSKDHEENLKQRAILLLKAQNNPEIQQIIMRQCHDDPLFFFNLFLWTYKPKAVGDEWEPEDPNLPFITYEFQDEFITDLIWCIENQQDNSTEKSREMWYSWQMLGIWLWWLLFRRWSGLIGSYKEEYVDKQWSMDSAFERLRYMLDRLPKWMKPSDMVAKFCSISSKELGAEIGGDSGENFGTWWRRKWVFMDEFALWRADEKAFRKTKDVTNCRIIGGTPEGRFNVYGKIMTNHPDYAHLNIRKFHLHWSKHPLKTLAWYEKQKWERTKLDMAKEIDISYDDSVSGAVYSDFTTLVRQEELLYNPNFRTYTAWDFGRDSNVLQIWQKDFDTNRVYMLRSIRRKWWHIRKFAAFCTGTPTQWEIYTEDELEFIKWVWDTIWLTGYSNHFWDPYNGDALQTNAIESIKEILAWLWIHLSLKSWSTVEWRITATTLSLGRMTVNKSETDFIQSMIQSHYPKVKENSQATTETRKPVHDENSHQRTATEYFFDNEPKMDWLKMEAQPRVFINKITGKAQIVQRWARLGLPQR